MAAATAAGTEPCPPAAVVPAAAAASSPAGAAAGRARIGDLSTRCTYADGRLSVDLSLAIAAERAAGAPASVRYDYFVAVTGPDRVILAKQVFPADIDFPDGADRAGSREELTQTIPLADPAAASGYGILVGFQLPPDPPDGRR